MTNTYADIAGRPGLGGFTLAGQQASNNTAANGNTGSGGVSDAQDAANFQRILDGLAAKASAQEANPAATSAIPGIKSYFPSSSSSSSTNSSSSVPSSASSTASAASSGGDGSFKSFAKNLWDVINPLQHIPVVSAIYRHATGDTISPGAHVAGDILYGAVTGGGAIIGGAISMADVAYQKVTGKDPGETVIASLTGSKGSVPSGGNTMLAQNNTQDLSQITPAAGGTAATAQAHAGKGIWPVNNSTSGSSSVKSASSNSKSNIIWSSESPLFPPSGTIGEGSANPSPAQPVLQASNGASTTVSQTQEAPAGAVRKTASPELIASRMMDGLQKYTQMKQQSMNPQLSGLY